MQPSLAANCKKRPESDCDLYCSPVRRAPVVFVLQNKGGGVLNGCTTRLSGATSDFCHKKIGETPAETYAGTVTSPESSTRSGGNASPLVCLCRRHFPRQTSIPLKKKGVPTLFDTAKIAQAAERATIILSNFTCKLAKLCVHSCPSLLPEWFLVGVGDCNIFFERGCFISTFFAIFDFGLDRKCQLRTATWFLLSMHNQPKPAHFYDLRNPCCADIAVLFDLDTVVAVEIAS